MFLQLTDTEGFDVQDPSSKWYCIVRTKLTDFLYCLAHFNLIVHVNFSANAGEVVWCKIDKHITEHTE
jgi:hypothetical protein